MNLNASFLIVLSMSRLFDVPFKLSLGSYTVIASIGHYHTWNSGAVLHRDIRDNNINLMRPIYLLPESSARSRTTSGPARGILNDFDLTTEINPGDSTPILRSPNHHSITGTLHFVACNLVYLKTYNTIKSTATAVKKVPNFDFLPNRIVDAWIGLRGQVVVDEDPLRGPI